MKLWAFIKWQSAKTTIGDLCYWSGAFLMGSSVVVDSQFSNYLFYAGIGIWLVSGLKFIVWEKYKQDYQEFSSEQNKLFGVIKNSDRS